MSAMDPDNRPPRIIADAMLGRLAKWLRLLGCDVAYERKIDDDELIRMALHEKRLVLTRDGNLARRRPAPLLFIRDDHLPNQLRQVVRDLNLPLAGRRFTRCIECNAELAVVEKDAVRTKVPAYVFETQDRFSECPDCGRIYWPGTHHDRAVRRLEEFFPEGDGPS